MTTLKLLSINESREIEHIYSAGSDKPISSEPMNNTYRASMDLEMPSGNKITIEISESDVKKITDDLKNDSWVINPDPLCPKCKGAGWIWGKELDKDPDYDTDQKYDCDSCLKDRYVDSSKNLFKILRDENNYLHYYFIIGSENKFRITSNPWIQYNNGKLEAVVTVVFEKEYYRFFVILNDDIYHQVLALIKDMKDGLFKTWLKFDGKVIIAQ